MKVLVLESNTELLQKLQEALDTTAEISTESPLPIMISPRNIDFDQPKLPKKLLEPWQKGYRRYSRFRH